MSSRERRGRPTSWAGPQGGWRRGTQPAAGHGCICLSAAGAWLESCCTGQHTLWGCERAPARQPWCFMLRLLLLLVSLSRQLVFVLGKLAWSLVVFRLGGGLCCAGLRCLPAACHASQCCVLGVCSSCTRSLPAEQPAAACWQLLSTLGAGAVPPNPVVGLLAGELLLRGVLRAGECVRVCAANEHTCCFCRVRACVRLIALCAHDFDTCRPPLPRPLPSACDVTPAAKLGQSRESLTALKIFNLVQAGLTATVGGVRARMTSSVGSSAQVRVSLCLSLPLCPPTFFVLEPPRLSLGGLCLLPWAAWLSAYRIRLTSCSAPCVGAVLTASHVCVCVCVLLSVSCRSC